MKKGLLLALLCLSGTAIFSQTKLISHRSHSGSNATFSLNGADNFGEFMIDYYKYLEENKADSLSKDEHGAILDSVPAGLDSMNTETQRDTIKKIQDTIRDRKKQKVGKEYQIVTPLEDGPSGK